MREMIVIPSSRHASTSTALHTLHSNSPPHSTRTRTRPPRPTCPSRVPRLPPPSPSLPPSGFRFRVSPSLCFYPPFLRSPRPCSVLPIPLPFNPRPLPSPLHTAYPALPRSFILPRNTRRNLRNTADYIHIYMYAKRQGAEKGKGRKEEEKKQQQSLHLEFQNAEGLRLEYHA